MNTTTSQPFADVRGSWEATLNEANRLASNFNDDAIPLYEKVYSGLLRIPGRLRKANNERLQTLLVRAGLALHAYLNYRDRFDESLKTLRSVLDVVDNDDDQEMIQSQLLDVLIMSDQYDDALASALEIAEQEPEDVYNWGRVALVCTRIHRPELAWQWLDRAQQVAALELGEPVDELDTESASTDARTLLTYLHGVESIVAIENGAYDHAREAIARVLMYDGLYAQNLPIFYTRLIAREQYELALELIEKDQATPARAAYWQGLAQFLRGQEQDAKRTWQDSLRKLDRQRQSDDAAPETLASLEYVLTRYQLGDPEGLGLELVLRSLREGRNVSWVQFMLAGIGWELRGDHNTATSDLDVALARYKSSGDGRQLPLQYWWSVSTLFDEETQSLLRPYFQTELFDTSRSAETDSSA